jgi:glycosyltransferase involved in cell wall biosynthesis
MNPDLVPDLALHIERFEPQHRSLRVAWVTETYPPEVNGVALTVERIVQGLQSRRHAVQLIRPRQPLADASPVAASDDILTRGMPIPRYPHLRMGLPAKKALLAQWTLQRPDLVHIATEGPLGWSALQAARKLRLVVSTDFRTNFHAYSRHYGMGWLKKPIAAYLRKFHNLAHCTMVPTRQLQDELSVLGFERLHVVARGVDAARFTPERRSAALRSSWGVAPNDPVVLHVGRLAAEKNLGLLLQAFEAMRQVQPRVRLVVVGDGPERAALLARCPDALWAGERKGDDLAAHYASADLFLFPSLTETYGNVVPEALASGLAVLGFQYAAAAQLIEPGRNGLLAPLGDASAFVDAAVALVSSPGLVQALRLQARASVQGLDWSRIAEQIEAVWLGLLDGGLPATGQPLSAAPAGWPAAAQQA